MANHHIALQLQTSQRKPLFSRECESDTLQKYSNVSVYVVNNG